MLLTSDSAPPHRDWKQQRHDGQRDEGLNDDSLETEFPYMIVGGQRQTNDGKCAERDSAGPAAGDLEWPRKLRLSCAQNEKRKEFHGEHGRIEREIDGCQLLEVVKEEGHKRID